MAPSPRSHRRRRWVVVTATMGAVVVGLVPAGDVAAGPSSEAEGSTVACPLPYEDAMQCAEWWGVMGGADAKMPVARGQMARVVAATVVRSGTAIYAPADNLFSDDDGHPEELVIAELAALGLVRGTSPSAASPDAQTTRGQLAAVAVRAAAVLLDREPSPIDTPFTDIASSVHRVAVEQAYGLGLVRGVDAEHFRPGAGATYGQLAAVVTRLLGLLVAEDVVDPPLSAGSFSLTPVPARVDDSIPGQHLVLLVTVADVTGAGPILFEATAPGAVVSAADDVLRPGLVVEVSVVPEPGGGEPDSPEAWLPVTFTGTRDGERHQVVVPVRVLPGEDLLESAATEILARWTDWLGRVHPELGIGPSTEWSPTITKPNILVVSHYLFYSDQWELGLTWHIMIPPYDWTEVYLRPRNELLPAHAFRLDSRTDPSAVPHAVEPPAVVDR